MTIEQFARHLGMSARGVASWSQKPAVVLATLTQQILDAALDGAPPDVQARFEDLLAGDGLGAAEADATVADDSADLDTWNLAEAIVRSSISPQVMDRFERLTAAQASRYPSSPPAEMWPVIRRELARAEQALQQRQSLRIQRRLVAVVGQLAGLAGNLAIDLGRRDKAAEYFDLGRLAGEEAGDDDLAAWAIALQSIDPYFNGNGTEAAMLLDQAAQLAANGSSARRRAWIESLRARAHAAGGDRQQATTALITAYRIIGETEPPTGTDFFNVDRLDGIAGTTYLLLRDTSQAIELIGSAIKRRSRSDAKGRALLMLDHAACCVLNQSGDEAAALVHHALDEAEGQIVRPILVRAREVRSGMTRWRNTEPVKAIDERLAALHRDRTEGT